MTHGTQNSSLDRVGAGRRTWHLAGLPVRQAADARAAEAYDTRQVLKAVEIIQPGETLAQAQQAGKIAMGTVPNGPLLDGALSGTTGLADKVALTTVYPGEQIVAAKFGSPGDQKVLTIPDGKMAISVNLTDPARVAGFVSPGRGGRGLRQRRAGGQDLQTGATTKLPEFTRLLLPRVQVIGVGRHDGRSPPPRPTRRARRRPSRSRGPCSRWRWTRTRRSGCSTPRRTASWPSAC